MKNSAENIFNNPSKYLPEFYRKSIFPQDVVDMMVSEFKGLSMMCVWLTKLCPLNCEKCFFRSNMNHDGLKKEEYQFSDEGIDKLIKFINASNNGYLMLSGGGDPMVCVNHVVRIIRETVCRRIVIVTSGFWGKTEAMAHKNLELLYTAFTESTSDEPCEVVVRLSVDSYHEVELKGSEAYGNIINVFKRNYSDKKGFSLMIHTMKDDKCVEELTDMLGGHLSYGGEGESDNSDVIKIVPRKACLHLGEYTVPIGISKLFLSDLMIDMHPPYSKAIMEAVRVMTDDMENSEQGNPSYIQNAFGRKGLDFWVDYNGNVTTWFNQDWQHLFNLYVDDYEKLVQDTFSNPMTAFFLRKGYEYRNNIIAEVNPLALLRAQAINLRDYFAAFLLEEDNTKLYYAIRTIQSFLSEFFIHTDDLKHLSEELQAAIRLPVNELKELYAQADYDILIQWMDEKRFDEKKWRDAFLLIALGQYKVSPSRLQEKISFYSKQTNQSIESVSEFRTPYSKDQYARLHQRISFIKPEAYQQLYGINIH